MAHDFDWKAGPRGGSLTDLDTISTFVRVLDEGSPGSRGDNVPIQYLHGAREVAHLFSTEALIALEVGVATKAQLTSVKQLLYGGRQMVTLQKNDPSWGVVQIDGKIFQPVIPTQDRFTYLFPMLCADPFWRSTTLQSLNPVPTLTVGGNAPVDDAEIVFTGGTDATLTHTDSGAVVALEGATPSGGVRCYVKTGFAARVTGGTDWSEFFFQNMPFIVELDSGASNAFTLTGGGSVVVEFRNKWR
jgi:hypothetical protein